MAKNIPLSVRISSEDADFIAALKIDDAITPSDKIRAIIRNARLQQKRGNDYEGGLKTAREDLRAVTQLVKARELEMKQHSELVSAFTEWLGEAYSYTSTAPQTCQVEKKLDVKQLENGIADRCFRLLELIARMGVTTKAPCYDKEIITKGFDPLAELMQLINQRFNK